MNEYNSFTVGFTGGNCVLRSAYYLLSDQLQLQNVYSIQYYSTRVNLPKRAWSSMQEGGSNSHVACYHMECKYVNDCIKATYVGSVQQHSESIDNYFTFSMHNNLQLMWQFFSPPSFLVWGKGYRAFHPTSHLF